MPFKLHHFCRSRDCEDLEGHIQGRAAALAYHPPVAVRARCLQVSFLAYLSLHIAMFIFISILY